MNTYTNRDVLRVFPDLKTRTLISWSEKGLFTPLLAPDGPGSRRLYSVKNLLEIGIIRELVLYRFSLFAIKSILNKLSGRLASDDDDYDYLVICRRQYSPHVPESLGYVEEIIIDKRSTFNEQAGKLIFGEQKIEINEHEGRKQLPFVGSSILVSVLDIWNIVKARM